MSEAIAIANRKVRDGANSLTAECVQFVATDCDVPNALRVPFRLGLMQPVQSAHLSA
jgi:hypothetical protein